MGAVVPYWHINIAVTASSCWVINWMCYVSEAITFVSIVLACDSEAMEEVQSIESL